MTSRYVEMLEQQQAQLVIGLQELYRRTLEGEGWPGSPLKPSASGHPLTHDILERLGALKTEGSNENETFEEDLNLVQQRLLANGAGVMQRQDSSDGSSSNGDSSPTFATKPMFSTDFVTQFPPTPPNYSPYPRPQRLPAQLPSQSPTQAQCIKQDPLDSSPQQQPQQQFFSPKQQQQQQQPQPQQPPSVSSQTFFPNPPALQQNNNHNPLLHRQPTWSQISESVLDDTMDFFRSFDPQQQQQQQPQHQPALSLENLDYFRAAAQLPRQPFPTGLNSCLGQPDWNDEDFKAFFNPSPSLLS